jgi:hypothetical protein
MVVDIWKIYASLGVSVKCGHHVQTAAYCVSVLPHTASVTVWFVLSLNLTPLFTTVLSLHCE